MANLSQLIVDLQTRFRDVGGNFISATPATLYLNIAFEDFQNDVEPNWREYGFFVTGKQYRYALPADALHTLTAMWYQNGQYEIPYLSPQEFKSRGYLNRRITVSTPQAYTIMDGQTGKELYLGPAPGTTSNNSLVTTSPVGPTDVIIDVADTTKFQSPAGMVLIDSEQIAYQNNDSTVPGFLRLCLRGQGGTTAASHTTCTNVYRLDLVIAYTYQHKYLSAMSDVPVCPAQYQRICLHYAMYLALKQDGRDKQAEEELKIYIAKRTEAKRQVRLLTRDKNNRRITTAYM